jgi:YggT family protein
VSLIWTILYLVLLVYTLLLWARLVIEIIQSFARDYRPKGFVLLLLVSSLLQSLLLRLAV